MNFGGLCIRNTVGEENFLDDNRHGQQFGCAYKQKTTEIWKGCL